MVSEVTTLADETELFAVVFGRNTIGISTVQLAIGTEFYRKPGSNQSHSLVLELM